MNPIFMYLYLDEQVPDHPSKVDREITRKNFGYTLQYLLNMDISSMTLRMNYHRQRTV